MNAEFHFGALATHPASVFSSGGRSSEDTHEAADRDARKGNVLPVDPAKPETICRAVIVLGSLESGHSGAALHVNAGRSAQFLN